MKSFTQSINQKVGPSATIKELAEEIGDNVATPEFKPYEDRLTLPYEVPDSDASQDFNTYIGAKVMLPIGDQMRTGKVQEHKRHVDGSKVSKSNSNPLFDARQYIIKFPDGAEKEYTTNTIAQNMYLLCDPDGEQ